MFLCQREINKSSKKKKKEIFKKNIEELEYSQSNNDICNFHDVICFKDRNNPNLQEELNQNEEEIVKKGKERKTEKNEIKINNKIYR